MKAPARDILIVYVPPLPVVTDLPWLFYPSLSCHLWVFLARLGYALEDEDEVFRTLAQYQRLACNLGAVLLVDDDDETQLVLVSVPGVKAAKEQ